MLKIKNQSINGVTWTEVTITTAALTRFTMGLRTPAAWRIAIADPGPYDSETGDYFTVASGAVWTEALGGQLPNKKIWVAVAGGANVVEFFYAFQGTES